MTRHEQPRKKLYLRPQPTPLRDLTAELLGAASKRHCSLIKDTTLYTTDRPHTAGQLENTSTHGNSEVEAGHTFVIWELLSQLGAPADFCVSMNNVRTYGPVSDREALHFHGYSNKKMAEAKKLLKLDLKQLIILQVQAIAPHDNTNETVSFNIRRKRIESSDSRSVAVLIHERNSLLEVMELETGDLVIIPSGVAHTFSVRPGYFASYTAMEIADDPRVMYQTHTHEEEGLNSEVNEWITNTIVRDTGKSPEVDKPTMADIPSIRDYVRPSEARHI